MRRCLSISVGWFYARQQLECFRIDAGNGVNEGCGQLDERFNSLVRVGGVDGGYIVIGDGGEGDVAAEGLCPGCSGCVEQFGELVGIGDGGVVVAVVFVWVCHGVQCSADGLF